MLVWQAQQSATNSQLRTETGAWQLGQEQIEILSSIRIVSEDAIKLALSEIGEVSGEAAATDFSRSAEDVSNTGNGPSELKSKRGTSAELERLSTFNEEA